MMISWCVCLILLVAVTAKGSIIESEEPALISIEVEDFVVSELEGSETGYLRTGVLASPKYENEPLRNLQGQVKTTKVTITTKPVTKPVTKPPTPKPVVVAATQKPIVAPTQKPIVAPTQKPIVAPTQRPAVATTRAPTIRIPTTAPSRPATAAPPKPAIILPLAVYTVANNLNTPEGICEDLSGYIYVTQYDGHIVNKASVSANILVAGTNGVPGFSGDGGLATAATSNYPSGVAIDALGNFYFAEEGNHCIRKVTVSTGIITTVAGTAGWFGYSGDEGSATSAALYQPNGVAVDAVGNIYIADTFNNCIRKVTVSTGVITTVAGLADWYGYSGDGGPATSATLYKPNGVAVDAVGNIYIADFGNHCIRKVTVGTGVITTVAGTGEVPGFAGDKGLATLAKLNSPYDVAVDKVGNIYIADTYNYCIRKVTVSTGIITTIAGVGGVAGDSPDGTAATLTYIGYTSAIATGRNGIYFADQSTGKVRVIR